MKVGHHVAAMAYANPHFGSKIKIPKNMSKYILQIIYTCSVQKTAPKNTKNSRNQSILKIGHHAKAIAYAKSSLGSKIKLPKNMSKSILQIIYSCSVQKNPPKQLQIFEKWDHFENRPSCQGYSPCKILTLGQKFKFQKTCQNPFYKSFRVVLCRTPLQKHQIFEKWDHFENRPSCQGYSPWKILTLGQKKNSKKHVKIHSTNNLELLCAKKRS